MISLRKENNILIISADDQTSLKNSIIKSSLIRIGFTLDDVNNTYQYNASNSSQIIAKTVQFFTEYQEPLELDSECKSLFQETISEEKDFERISIEGERIKKEGSIENITIPFMDNRNKLLPYQIVPVLHSVTLGNSANFSVPGSGKTWMAYSTYFILKNKNIGDKDKVNKLLIVGPLSSFRVWEKEYENMTGEKCTKCKRITGSMEQRQEIFESAQRFEIFLVSYTTAMIEEDSIIKLLQSSKFMIILDESHHIKNPVSKQSIALRNISNYAKKRMILTGTMAPLGLQDLWSQFTFLYPDGRLLGSYDRFKFGLLDQNASANLTSRLSPFYTRISKKSLNLPLAKFYRIPVPMKEKQRRIYLTIAGHIRENDPNYSSDIYALRKWRNKSMVYLLEASTDPSLLPGINQFEDEPFSNEGLPIGNVLKHYEDIETPAKLETVKILAETAKKNNEKILIWCSFVNTIKKLEKMLQSMKPLTVYGAIARDDEVDEEDNRELRIEAFQTDPERNILIANPASLAESVSLHKVCHHAVYVDRTFNGGNYLQSLERIHRIGLDPKVETKYTILISEDSIDKDIDDRLEVKKRKMEHFLEENELNTLNLDLDYKNFYGDDEELDEDYQAVLAHLQKL